MLVVLAAVKPSQAYVNAAVAVLGSLIGGTALFLIARKGGEEYLERYTTRGRGARLRAWFMEYGMITVFIPALVPIPLPLKIFILSAGALEVPPLRFILVFAFARIPRYLILAWLGTKLGAATWPYIRAHMWQLTLASVALFVALYVAIRILHLRRAKIGTHITSS